MTELFWIVRWTYGVRSLNDIRVEEGVIAKIKSRMLGVTVEPSQVGLVVDAQLDTPNSAFTATLDKVEPPGKLVVNSNTGFRVRLEYTIGKDGRESVADDQELNEHIVWRRTFDPYQADEHYERMYASLVGIDKDRILNDLISLLVPITTKHDWSRRHYGSVIPMLRAVARKAPIMVLAGDPGTGKTALALSIGAVLSRAIGERIHFRQMSLSLRGKGFQGRASSMIVEMFKYFSSEYEQLHEPIVVFFDEADALVGSRQELDGSGSQENNAIVNAILKGIDSLRENVHTRIIVLFATNIAHHLDIALLRRSYIYIFERPNDKSRYQLFETTLRGVGLGRTELEALVAATEPKQVKNATLAYTHSDIVELIIGRALDDAIRSDVPINLNLLLNYCDITLPTGFTKL